MKPFLKGIFLGVLLVALNNLCSYFLSGADMDVRMFVSAIVFGAVVCIFLISKSIAELLICGFAGLFTMFFVQIATLDIHIGHWWLEVYVGGFYGSMAALVIAVILTLKKIDLYSILFGRCKIKMTEPENKIKIRLLLYTAISALGFSYLVMPENSAVSVPVFVLLQAVCLWLVVRDKKRLLFLIPVAVMSLNCFLSANHIWRASNLLISIVLFSCMFVSYDFKRDSLGYLGDMAVRLVSPFVCFVVPFKWSLELNHGKSQYIKRIALAFAIAIPCAVVLMVVLSRADMVFSIKTEMLFDSIFRGITSHMLFVALCGIFAGLYLFGIQFCEESCDGDDEEIRTPRIKGDLIIINILLSVILVVYTMFIVVQFKYLFAGAMLPQGLTFTEYARKGFFELLALTGVNVAAIIAVIRLIRLCEGPWRVVAKGLCHYLCAVTVVLLISSFYRMWLYTNDDGLTRLRFFVMGFLLFEAVGLAATFLYIAKEKINISLIYLCIALTYYTVLNIIPADNIIAGNQIDKFLSGERENLEYIYTLSADAAPSMLRLFEETRDENVKNDIREFLKNQTASEIPIRWQRYNLAIETARDVFEKCR